MTLKRTPMRIDLYNWYYEDTKGITLVHQVWESTLYTQRFLQTDAILIPWRKLRESVERKYGGKK